MKATTKNTILLLTLPLALCVGSAATHPANADPQGVGKVGLGGCLGE